MLQQTTAKQTKTQHHALCTVLDGNNEKCLQTTGSDGVMIQE